MNSPLILASILYIRANFYTAFEVMLKAAFDIKKSRFKVISFLYIQSSICLFILKPFVQVSLIRFVNVQSFIHFIQDILPFYNKWNQKNEFIFVFPIQQLIWKNWMLYLSVSFIQKLISKVWKLYLVFKIN